MNREAIVEMILTRIEKDSMRIAAQWAAPEGTSTKYFVVDNLLPADIATRAYESFPIHSSDFALQSSFRERKRVLQDPSFYVPLLSAISEAMQDDAVLDLISNIVQIEGLEADVSLARGGLSMMLRGDFLNPHIDNSHDAKRDRYRRLNLLYYVSPDWSLEKGGNFELWDESRKIPKTILSLQNRLVVMETTSRSWHSVSPVVTDAVRCCISNYYYSGESPNEKDYYHVTSFRGRPDQPIRTIVGSVDNVARNVVSKATGLSRPARKAP